MTQETETASPAVGINGRDNSDARITRVYDTSKSSASKGVKGRGWVCCAIRGGHQVSGGRVWRFNRPSYTSSISNFKGEMENFVVVLGTTAEQIEDKYQYKKLREKLKQDILQ